MQGTITMISKKKSAFSFAIIAAVAMGWTSAYATKGGVGSSTRNGKGSSSISQETLPHKLARMQDSLLPPRLNTIDFRNGGGYVQLSKHAARRFRNETGRLIREELVRLFGPKKSSRIGTWTDDAMRFMYDTGSPVYPIALLSLQIDPKFRLWGQMYFASHPSEGVQKPLNK